MKNIRNLPIKYYTADSENGIKYLFETLQNISHLIYRKGKTKSLDIVERDKTGGFVTFFSRLGELHQTVDLDVASEFVCLMYAESKTKDVNDARCNKLLQMTGKVDKVTIHLCI